MYGLEVWTQEEYDAYWENLRYQERTAGLVDNETMLSLDYPVAPKVLARRHCSAPPYQSAAHLKKIQSFAKRAAVRLGPMAAKLVGAMYRSLATDDPLNRDYLMRAFYGKPEKRTQAKDGIIHRKHWKKRGGKTS